jgi:hypothetical protein
LRQAQEPRLSRVSGCFYDRPGPVFLECSDAPAVLQPQTPGQLGPWPYALVSPGELSQLTEPLSDLLNWLSESDSRPGTA